MAELCMLQCADLLTRRRGLWSVGACASQSRRVNLALLLLASWCTAVFPLPPVTHRRPANPFQHFPWGCFAFFPTRPAFTQLCSSSSNTGHPSSPAVLRTKASRGVEEQQNQLPTFPSAALAAGNSTMSVNFPKAEEDVLQFWRDIDAFQTQLRLTEDKPRFTFYDGPPFGMFHSPCPSSPYPQRRPSC